MRDCMLQGYRPCASLLRMPTIGYFDDRDPDNAQVLRIICPNTLKMDHKDQRQAEGLIRLTKDTRELLDKVEKLYKSWFIVWRDTVVPKVMFQPKWYNFDKDVRVGDLVYFQEKEGKANRQWTIRRAE